MLTGKVLNADIEVVEIVSEQQQTYIAEIVEYEPGERFWFFISKDDDLSGATVTAMSQDGEIIEQMTR